MTLTNRNSGQTQGRFTPPKTSPSPPSDGASPPALVKDVYRIIRDLVLFFCRRIIFGPVQFKLILTLVIILVGSFLKDRELAPQSYFALKSNIFNRYFAKLGWAWTIGLLAPFIYLTLIKTHNIYQIITRHLVRLLVATILWYFITYFFVNFEMYTGYCKPDDKRSLTRMVCVKGGHEWQDGFDLSGHTFLLLYSLLIINEEVKSYDRGTKKIDQANEKTKNQSGDSAEAILEQERWKIYAKIIRVLYVLLAALTIIWEFMLLSTALYFHHTTHKIAAAVVAILCWYVTYYVWYRPDGSSLLYPSTPKE